MGLRFGGLGFKVQVFRVQGLKFKPYDILRGVEVWGVSFRVKGLVFRVLGFGV